MGLRRREQMRSYIKTPTSAAHCRNSGSVSIGEAGETERGNCFTTQGVTELVYNRRRHKYLRIQLNLRFPVSFDLRDHRGRCARFSAGYNASVLDWRGFKREYSSGTGSKRSPLVCQRSQQRRLIVRG
jgi:hypothetical protein